jgi:hypothetical protein
MVNLPSLKHIASARQAKLERQICPFCGVKEAFEIQIPPKEFTVVRHDPDLGFLEIYLILWICGECGETWEWKFQGEPIEVIEEEEIPQGV